ncbi:MAG: leucine-rich repeat domain-containing protein, partial [Salinivirgaceae bacterium]|nr:leucine-rich repeat domain-containing protein [Salinivirgaceae bacterium]
MKRIFAFLFVSLLASQAWADGFDFSAESENGQTIYYHIIGTNEVETTYPGNQGTYPYYYNEYPRPTGNLIIPETVSYNGTTYSVTRIGWCAYNGCSELTSVTIPNTVTGIDAHAFRGTGLISVTIPESIKSVGVGVFDYNLSLTEIVVSEGNTEFASSNGVLYNKSLSLLKCYPGGIEGEFSIPNTVTEIEDYAFYGCGKLTSVTIPNSVVSIGRAAFFNCRNLASVVIPESVNHIGSDAFFGCGFSFTEDDDAYYLPNGDNPYYALMQVKSNDIASYTINGSCKIIADDVFFSCTGLTSIEIPETVKTIGNSAFYNCSSLASVTIPESVETIGDGAFFYCSNLANVEYNPFKTSVGRDAFWGTKYIESSTSEYNDGTLKYSISIGMATVTGYIDWPNSVTIPEKITVDGKEYPVTGIGDGAFTGYYSLESVIIPNSVKTIGGRAFANCVNMSTVTIPKSVESVGNDAFLDVNNIVLLKDLEGKPWGAKSWNMNYRLSDDGKELLEVYFGEQYPAEIYIPYGVETIADGVFSGLDKLTRVHIPNTVKTIGDNAFAGCTGLSYIVRNDIGYNVLNDKEVEVTRYFKDYGNSYSGDVVIPESISLGNKTYSVTRIGDHAFSECGELTIDIPSSVTSIGSGAFSKCGLESIVIPESVESIGEGAFCFGWLLKEITIPNSITSIPNRAFQNCSSLASVTLGNSVESIGENAFERCESLTSIVIPESVKTIGENAFNDCQNLKSVTLGNSVDSIGNYAFYHCISLTSIDLPESVKFIGKDAFTGTKVPEEDLKLKNNQQNNNQEIINGVIYKINGSEATVAGYRKDANITKVRIPATVTIDGTDYPITSIGSFAFSNCQTIQSVIVGNTVTSIGQGAFANCHNIRELEISNSVETIGNKAFYGCHKLATVVVPRNAQIGESAFSYVKNVDYYGNSTDAPWGALTLNGILDDDFIYYDANMTKITAYIGNSSHVTIPEGVTSIGYMSFFESDNLESVRIPNTVKYIGGSAFANCYKLGAVNVPLSVVSV